MYINTSTCYSRESHLPAKETTITTWYDGDSDDTRVTNVDGFSILG